MFFYVIITIIIYILYRYTLCIDIFTGERKVRKELQSIIDNFNESDEIERLLKEMNKYTEEQRKEITYKYDNIYDNYKEYITKKEYNNIMRTINILILKLKFYYNRKRPKTYSKSIKPVYIESALTPTYPSGHAVQYYYIALYIKNKYNNTLSQKQMNRIDEIAENGSMSRIIGGLHFFADKEAGKRMAEIIFKEHN